MGQEMGGPLENYDRVMRTKKMKQDKTTQLGSEWNGEIMCPHHAQLRDTKRMHM